LVIFIVLPKTINMNILTLVIGLLVFFVTACKADPYDDFIKKFTDNYNAQNFAASYDLTAESFQKQITKAYFTEILTGTFATVGKINDHKVVQSNTGGKVFQLNCERGALALTVMLDGDGKASGLLIRPVDNPSEGGVQGQINKWKANTTNAGLVIGKLKDGKVDVQYLGVASKETSSPLTAESIFEIGSISKPFTGILLHLLMAEGKISLDDPVNKYLPKDHQLPKVNDKDIIIRNLVTHSACLPRMPGNFHTPQAEMTNPYRHYSEKDLLDFLPGAPVADCTLFGSPTYSNLGAGITGYILTRVSGKSYTELFNQGIAQPLGTRSFGIDGESDKWTSGHTLSGVFQSRWDFTDALVGAGGVDASAEDLVKVLKFLMSPDQSPLGKAVSASTTLKLMSSQGGFGTFWVRQPSGQKTIIWHNGMTGGYNAFLGWIEGTQTGVFILSNNGVDASTGLGMAMLNEQ
jgi:CubicO group peptidase (beta-lactamase class C family)